MDNDQYDRAVGEKVREAIIATVGSVQRAAKETGIAYATLDRKLRGLSPFNVSELRRIAQMAGRKTSTFLPTEPKTNRPGAHRAEAGTSPAPTSLGSQAVA